MQSLFPNLYTMLVEEINPLTLHIKYKVPYSLAIVFHPNGSMGLADTSVDPSSIVFHNEGTEQVNVMVALPGEERPKTYVLQKGSTLVVGLEGPLTFEVSLGNVQSDIGSLAIFKVTPATGAVDPRRN